MRIGIFLLLELQDELSPLTGLGVETIDAVTHTTDDTVGSSRLSREILLHQEVYLFEVHLAKEAVAHIEDVSRYLPDRESSAASFHECL